MLAALQLHARSNMLQEVVIETVSCVASGLSMIGGAQRFCPGLWTSPDLTRPAGLVVIYFCLVKAPTMRGSDTASAAINMYWKLLLWCAAAITLAASLKACGLAHTLLHLQGGHQ